MFDSFADILFRLPVNEHYTYRIPRERVQDTHIGIRVECDFHHRIEEGIIIAIHNQPPDQNAKEILKWIDPEPIVTEDQIRLAFWVSNRYLSGPGEALFKMFPAGRRRPSNRKGQRHEEIVRYQTNHALNQEQRSVFEAVQKDLLRKEESSDTPIHLIQGITGSGKTELYIHIMKTVLELKKQVIFLVPEISLTVQLVDRLTAVFGDEISLLHSGLKGSDRFSAYIQSLRANTKIAVGTRSSVFAPLTNIGAIILDEEHDSSYREHSSPRYDARQVAYKRAQDHNAVVVAGSATPRLESYYQAVRGGQRNGGFFFHLHHLTGRATGSELSRVEMVDPPPADIPISAPLLGAIAENLKKKEQTLLLLNRRGHTPFLYCDSCKKTRECPRCSVTLNLHKNGRLLCHYCGYTENYSQKCPVCGGKERHLGSGTQRVEDYLLNTFPEARLERLDTDILSGGQSPEETIHRLIAGEVDILVGTQMIAKGLDAPNLTLVGVLQADSHLAIPDFRAAEKTFSLLTQVAGRAGRATKAGRVIFEVHNPEDPVLRFARNQNYNDFFQMEIATRRSLLYPPFCRLVRLLYRSSSKEHSALMGEKLRLYIEEQSQAMMAGERFVLEDGSSVPDPIILGPVAPPVEKINEKYRCHILLKTNQPVKLRTLLESIPDSLKRGPQDTYLEIDIDPSDMM